MGLGGEPRGGGIKGGLEGDVRASAGKFAPDSAVDTPGTDDGRTNIGLYPWRPSKSNVSPRRGVCNPMLSLLAVVADPFGLGTSWASGFADIAARPTTVRTAPELRAAVARGGLVRLAAGEYDLRGGKLTIGPKTVLKGAGRGKTVLLVGGIRPEEYAVEFFATALGGMRDLTVRNVNPTAVPNGVVMGMWGGIPNAKGFLIGVDFDLGGGLPVLFNSPTDFLVRDCRFTSTSMLAAPILLCGGMRFRFERNVVDWRTGRANLTEAEDSAIVDNEFRLDGRYRGPGRPETGGVELGGAVNTDFARNRVVQYGRRGSGDNDGEMINVQNTWPEYMDAGKVVSASGLLVGTDLRWGSDPWYAPLFPRSRRRTIFVLSGTGAGQWRWAEPSGDGTVRVDRPWGAKPRAGDRVSVGSLSAYDLRIAGNTVEGGNAGLVVWNGGVRVSVTGNTFRNTGPLAMRAATLDMERPRTPRSRTENFPLWDCVVSGNTLVNSEGRRPAMIQVHSTDVQASGLPLAIRGITVEGNTIRGRSQRWGVLEDGIVVSSVVETSGARPRPERVSGVVVRNNALVGGVRRVLEKAP